MAGKKYPLSIVIRTIDEATADLRKITSTMSKLGGEVERAGKTLTAALTLPIVGIGAASVKAFGEFEKGMANVSTLIDTNTESLAEMSKDVLAIGARTPVAMEDLTKGLYDLRSAGVSATDQMMHLEQAAKLGVAGLGSTAESVDIATSALNAFHLQGEEAARLYDTIFKTTKYGKTTISDLSQGFGGTAAILAGSGVKLDEFMAATAALTTPGLKATEAYTGLRNIVLGLTRTTDHSRKVFRALGAKDFDDLIAKSGGLVPALQRIDKQIGSSKAKWLDLQIGSEGLNSVLSLLGAQGQAFETAWKDMSQGAEALGEGFDKQNKTMQAQWQRTKNALTGAGVAIGSILAPALEGIAVKLQAAAAWFTSLDEGTQKWIIGIGATVAAIGPALIMMGRATKAFADMKLGIDVLQKGFKGLTKAIATNPIGAAVTLLAIAAVMIIENWEPIEEFFVMLWDGIVEVFDAAWAKIKPIVDKVVGAAEAVADAAGAVTDWIFGEDEPASTGNAFAPLRTAQREILGTPGAFSAFNPARLVAGAGPGAPQQAQAALKVEFVNAPRGTRVAEESARNTAVDLSVGYQMGALP